MRRTSVVATAALVLAVILAAADAAAQTLHGTGTVRAVLPRVHRLILDAAEIPGYMAAMEMSYPVAPASLLDGVRRGDKVEFDLDAKTSSITALKVVP